MPQDSTSRAAILLYYESRILEGKCRDIYSHFRCSLVSCCFYFDYPFSGLSLRQTPNHMPRLDCPSVSAETLRPWVLTPYFGAVATQLSRSKSGGSKAWTC